jgi:spermidine synthase
MHEVRTVARSDSDGFEIALRRRGQGANAVDELIVNGAFAMDSASTQSEKVLAEALGPAPGTVLVGGLGLGYTTSRLLELGAQRVDVVELSGALIDWAHDGLTPLLGSLANDPRVTLHHGDVADVLDAQPAIPGLFGPWDSICLDIDNGPSFLIHAANARVYTPEALASAMQHLNPGGRLAIWAEGPSNQLWSDLLRLDPDATERLVPLTRGNREMDYAVYTVTRR